MPLAGTILLAAGLTLLWLRPPHLLRRLALLAWPLGGLLLGYLPWRLFAMSHGIETGSHHILGFYWEQLFKAVPALGLALMNPNLFGILWPATALALAFTGRKVFTTPILFLVLFLGGNFLAILLAYAVSPTSPFEFHLYLRATIDRLLLHLTPAAALTLGEGVQEWMSRNLGPVGDASATAAAAYHDEARSLGEAAVENRENVVRMLDSYMTSLQKLRGHDIESPDAKAVTDFLETAMKAHDQWLAERTQADWQTVETAEVQSFGDKLSHMFLGNMMERAKKKK